MTPLGSPDVAATPTDLATADDLQRIADYIAAQKYDIDGDLTLTMDVHWRARIIRALNAQISTLRGVAQPVAATPAVASSEIWGASAVPSTNRGSST